MWKNALLVAALAGTNAAPSPTAAADGHAIDNQWRAAWDRQQDSIQALARRGLLNNYAQLEAEAKIRDSSRPAKVASQSVAPELTETISREVAINLAALGFTMAEVSAYGRRNIDLFDIANRVFTARGTSAEQMLMSDTVLIAKALTKQTGHTRSDGFLSAVPFTVIKSLKGPRAARDVVYVPQDSGVTPEGRTIAYSHEAEFKPGKTYLLTLSENWYRQRVAQQKKQTEAGFNAMIFLAYEVNRDGSLVSGPKPPRIGGVPTSINSVKSELKATSSN